MAADRAFDPGETEMQVAAIQVFIDHIHDIWPPVAVSASAGELHTPTNSNKRNKKIGNRSEKKVYKKLVEIYEKEYVSWKSKEDEGLHYDIRYSPDNGKIWKFVEVKTFTNNRFYLSKEEKAFGEKHKENYEIWLVQDINLYPYKIFVDNNFEITAKEYIVSISIDTND